MIKLIFMISDESDTIELCLTKGITTKACQFPYVLDGTERTKCAYNEENERFECPTQVDENKEPLPGSWEECKDNCPGGLIASMTSKFNSSVEKLNASFALYLTGICFAKTRFYDTSLPCPIPFEHDGQVFNGCVPPAWQDTLYDRAKPWCPRQTPKNAYYDPKFRAECYSNCYVVCLITLMMVEKYSGFE